MLVDRLPCKGNESDEEELESAFHEGEEGDEGVVCDEGEKGNETSFNEESHEEERS